MEVGREVAELKSSIEAQVMSIGCWDSDLIERASLEHRGPHLLFVEVGEEAEEVEALWAQQEKFPRTCFGEVRRSFRCSRLRFSEDDFIV